MPGFKDFINLTVLTESDLDDYLAKQVVMKFATVAARDAALAAVLREGMLTYQDDVNTFTYYTGSAWLNLADHPDLTSRYAAKGLGHVGTGSVVANVNTMTNTWTIAGLSVTTPAVAGRRYKISLICPQGGQQNGAGYVAFNILEGVSIVQTLQVSRVAGLTPSGLSTVVVRAPAGAVTYTVTVTTTATSFDLYAAATTPTLLIVEDIGT